MDTEAVDALAHAVVEKIKERWNYGSDLAKDMMVAEYVFNNNSFFFVETSSRVQTRDKKTDKVVELPEYTNPKSKAALQILEVLNAYVKEYKLRAEYSLRTKDSETYMSFSVPFKNNRRCSLFLVGDSWAEVVCFLTVILHTSHFVNYFLENL